MQTLAPSIETIAQSKAQTIAPAIATKAVPFLKWTGSKRKLIPQYQQWLPDDVESYHEPFLGGGAMFFHLQPQQAILSDVNSRLVNCYHVVRDAVEPLISLLLLHEQLNSEDHFYRQRALCPTTIDRLDIEDAARFIYLNRTCFNGLYRVNLKGEFNSSWGKYKKPIICDASNLRLCSKALSSAQIFCQPWEDSLSMVDNRGCSGFVFLDPPYLPVDGQKTNFNSYDRPFLATDHQELADSAHDLVEYQGAQVLLANASTEASRALYCIYSHFVMERLQVKRTNGASAKSRGTVEELLVRSI